ncbi:hypothetical protein YKV113 [Yokapox virus]|uniref:Uncharacterized protein n=1 Tax=Yokapox virus TaxID=1076255 RepID=G3EI05_9POXV|nr:hypothetical protein YKV113 [Yokapox virus]AEN03702.1 unknown [Yokapox virus]
MEISVNILYFSNSEDFTSSLTFVLKIRSTVYIDVTRFLNNVAILQDDCLKSDIFCFECVATESRA